MGLQSDSAEHPVRGRARFASAGSVRFSLIAASINIADNSFAKC
jgi:hypothetical protein